MGFRARWVEWRCTPTCRRLCGAGDVVHERPQSFSQVGHGCIWIKKSLTPRGASQRGEHVAERDAGLVRVPRKRRKLRGTAALTMQDVPEYDEAHEPDELAPLAVSARRADRAAGPRPRTALLRHPGGPACPRGVAAAGRDVRRAVSDFREGPLPAAQVIRPRSGARVRPDGTGPLEPRRATRCASSSTCSRTRSAVARRW
jgi:hypothetical protein